MIKLIGKLKNKEGFTLIELIVVIAIIGIIAAIAIPRFSGFTDKADAARDDANEDIMYKAATLYLAENGNPNPSMIWTQDGAGSGESTEWNQYVDEWPIGISDVTISTSGTIVVN